MDDQPRHLLDVRQARVTPMGAAVRGLEDAVTYAEVGDRTVLREYVTINTGTNEGEVTHVGSDCLIMTHCHVAHGCKVGNHVIMSNVVQLAGEVEVEDYAILAGMAACHQFVRVGKHAMIGGMTPVAQDCPPYMLVSGNPPKVHGPNSIGLRRAGVDSEVRNNIKKAYKILFRSGMALSNAIEAARAEVPGSAELDHLLSFLEGTQRGVTAG